MTDILDSEVTCHACPVQIEGQLADGRYFYFRARYARAQLGIGVTAKDAVAATCGAALFDIQCQYVQRDLSHLGPYGAGDLSLDDARALLLELIAEAS